MDRTLRSQRIMDPDEALLDIGTLLGQIHRDLDAVAHHAQRLRDRPDNLRRRRDLTLIRDWLLRLRTASARDSLTSVAASLRVARNQPRRVGPMDPLDLLCGPSTTRPLDCGPAPRAERADHPPDVGPRETDPLSG